MWGGGGAVSNDNKKVLFSLFFLILWYSGRWVGRGEGGLGAERDKRRIISEYVHNVGSTTVSENLKFSFRGGIFSPLMQRYLT